MTTIYRANNARMSVAAAKRLISDAAPRGEALDIYACLDEQGNIDFDGPIETRLDPNANITRTFIDADFPALCARLGIVPTNKFRPVRTDYPNMPEIDEHWTIAHDEFVKLAALHGLFVEIGDAPEPQTLPVGAESASGETAWAVTTPQRYHGYSSPLHRLLTAAHRQGKPRPSARDALEEWRANTPAEIAKVQTDGIDYYDSQGNTKYASLEAIRKAIDRMTSAR